MLKSLLIVTLVLGCTYAAVYREFSDLHPSTDQKPVLHSDLTGPASTHNFNTQDTDSFADTNVATSYDKPTDTSVQTYAERTADIKAGLATCFSPAGWPELAKYSSLVADVTADSFDTGISYADKQTETTTAYANWATCLGYDLGSGYVADENIELAPECSKLSEYPNENYFEYMMAFKVCWEACRNPIQSWTFSTPSKFYGVQTIGGNFDNQADTNIILKAGAAVDSDVETERFGLHLGVLIDCLAGTDDSDLLEADRADTVDGKITYTPGVFSWYAWRINETAEQSRYVALVDCNTVCDHKYNARTNRDQRLYDDIWTSRLNDCLGSSNQNSLVLNDYLKQSDDGDTEFRIPYECEVFQHLSGASAHDSANGRQIHSFDPVYWQAKQSCTNFCVEKLNYKSEGKYNNKSYNDKVACENKCGDDFASAHGYDGEADADFEISEPTEIVDDGEGASILTAAVALLSFVLLTFA